MIVDAEDFIALWQSALADAGIPESEAVFLTFHPTDPDHGYRAMTWPRGIEINDPVELLALGEGAEQLVNSAAVIGLRRVAVRMERTVEGVAAAIRHELEHSLQFDSYPPAKLQSLEDHTIAALRDIVGDSPVGGRLYNALPTESDANAAASRFVRAHFGDDRIDELVINRDPDIALFRRPEQEESAGTLIDRMNEFLRHSGPELARKALAAGIRSPNADA